MKYSIIIPVYNAERTLPRCLDSIVKQDFSDYEVLLINDGSQDKSGAICQHYAQAHHQLRYFSQENGGVSSARNRGLAEAQGEYILFVDSDDYVDRSYFSTLDRALVENHPDLLLFGADSFGGPESRWNTGDFSVEGAQAVAQRAAEAMRGYLFSSLWNKVFLRSLIQGLRFDCSLDIGEDQAFIFACTMRVRSLASISETLYHVDLSDTDSLSRKARPYLTKQLLNCHLRMTDACRASSLEPEAAACYEAALSWVFYRSAYSCCKELLKLEPDCAQRRKKLRAVCTAYRAEHIRPQGLKCRLIALPVQLGLAGPLDYLVRHKNS